MNSASTLATMDGLGDDTLLHIFDICISSHSTLINLKHTCKFFNHLLTLKVTKTIAPLSSQEQQQEATSTIVLNDHWEKCVDITQQNINCQPKVNTCKENVSNTSTTSININNAAEKAQKWIQKLKYSKHIQSIKNINININYKNKRSVKDTAAETKKSDPKN